MAITNSINNSFQDNTSNAQKEVVLSTQRLNNTKQINLDLDFKKQAKLKQKRLIIFSSIIIGLLILMFRIPYIGSYLDAILFDYFFGIAKYFLYIWLIALCVIGIFKFKWLLLLSKWRYIYAQIFILLALCILFSALGGIIFEETWSSIINGKTRFSAKLVAYHSGHFFQYLGSVNYGFSGNESPWFINTYIEWKGADASQTMLYGFIITGGLIGEIVDAAQGYVLIVFTLLLCFLGILYFTSRSQNKFSVAIRKAIVHIFGGSAENIVTSDLSKQKGDVKVESVNKNEIKNIANNSNLDTPPITLLSDTSVDNYQKNKVEAERVRDAIIKFSNDKSINLEFKKCIIMPMFSEIYFEADSMMTIEYFLKNEVEVTNYTQLKEFNVSYKGNELRLEYINKWSSKVSIKSILSSQMVDTNKNNLVVGYSYLNQPLLMNLTNDTSILVIGKKGSGTGMLLSCLAITYAFLSTPDKFNIDIISKDPSNNFNSLKHLPHVKSFSTLDITNDNIGNMLLSYNNEIIDRKNAFEQLSASNIDEYNIAAKETGQELMPTKLLIFNDFNEIVKGNYQYLGLLRNILVDGQNCGIKIILAANNVTSEVIDQNIYNNVKTKLILRLETENESLQIFDSYRGSQLYGNGDGYMFNESPDDKIRFQTCYLNQRELDEIVKIISTFYQAKTE